MKKKSKVSKLINVISTMIKGGGRQVGVLTDKIEFKEENKDGTGTIYFR